MEQPGPGVGPPEPRDEPAKEIVAGAPYVVHPADYVNRVKVASMSDDEVFSWESQASQHPVTGPPGFSHERVQVKSRVWNRDDIFVDSVLYRDETGALLGIYNYFPNGAPGLENAGAAAVFVHPGHRREGIGSGLQGEALLRGLMVGRPRRKRGLSSFSESGAAWNNANNEYRERTGRLRSVDEALRLRAKHGQPLPPGESLPPEQPDTQ